MTKVLEESNLIWQVQRFSQGEAKLLTQQQTEGSVSSSPLALIFPI